MSYRKEAEVESGPMQTVELSTCSHCCFYERGWLSDKCLHPSFSGGAALAQCAQKNPKGECGLFKPSALTRFLRAFGARQPVVIAKESQDD